MITIVLDRQEPIGGVKPRDTSQGYQLSCIRDFYSQTGATIRSIQWKYVAGSRALSLSETNDYRTTIRPLISRLSNRAVTTAIPRRPARYSSRLGRVRLLRRVRRRLQRSYRTRDSDPTSPHPQYPRSLLRRRRSHHQSTQRR